MTRDEEIAQLAVLMERLGAVPAAAATMARQLSKRADQIAAERGETREVAMRRLLEKAVAGRQGIPPDEVGGA